MNPRAKRTPWRGLARDMRAAFTLVELLVVIAIIAILEIGRAHV